MEERERLGGREEMKETAEGSREGNQLCSDKDIVEHLDIRDWVFQALESIYMHMYM